MGELPQPVETAVARTGILLIRLKARIFDKFVYLHEYVINSYF